MSPAIGCPYPLAIVCDAVDDAQPLLHELAGTFAATIHAGRVLPKARAPEYVVVDINLANSAQFSELRAWLKNQPKDGVVVFAVDSGHHRQSVQASALGATAVLCRPLIGGLVMKTLLGNLSSLSDSLEPADDARDGLTAGLDALRNIFASALDGSLDPATVDEAGDKIVGNIKDSGLVDWVDAVRKYHSQTYQHCLLVTGVAVSFGQHLGFSQRDRRKLAFAGLLHDIGKARIPLSILEKPGPLEGDEIHVMRKHPVFGFEALRTMRGFDADMLKMVRHHHEYLDGSGYPDGLKGSEISDLIRIMTIADIYGALIERRSYKAPMPNAAAYGILRDMKSKLDPDLLREFEPVTHLAISGEPARSTKIMSPVTRP